MEALEKQKIINTITSGIVHDINNVLTTIVGYTDILLLNNSCSNCKEEIEIIRKVALDGAEIARRVKDFTKAKEDSKKVFDICDAVQTAIMITKPIWHNLAQIEGKNITFKYNKVFSVYTYGNESEFREALVNIIVNSVDAIEQKGVIQIDVSRDGQEAIIIIKDNGMGMTEETKNKIFDPFFTTKKENGSGLGLSNVIKTVNGMGGKIDVASKLYAGTEFKIIVPAVDEKAEEKKEIKKIHKKIDLNILIIDDQIEICSVLTEMLARIIQGKTEICTRGKEAIKLLENNNYDIVITDIAMPDISGLEVIQYIKKVGLETKTIAMTGWNGFVEKDKNIKPDYILSKPFTMEDLEDVICKIYGSRDNLVV